MAYYYAYWTDYYSIGLVSIRWKVEGKFMLQVSPTLFPVK